MTKKGKPILSEVESYYDEMSKKYDEGLQHIWHKVADRITWSYIERYLPQRQDAFILDAAGGTGRWAIPIAKRGYKVILVDISQGMLDVARKKIEKEGLQDSISLVKGDMSKLDYQDGFFDLVICLTDALQLVEDIDAVLREFHRVLKSNSFVIADLINLINCITWPTDLFNAESIKALVERLSKKEDFITCKSPEGKQVKWKMHFPKELKSLFETNGFSIEKIVGKTVWFHWRYPQIASAGSRDVQITGELFKNILKMELMLCEEPTLLGISAKTMIIARKP